MMRPSMGVSVVSIALAWSGLIGGPATAAEPAGRSRWEPLRILVGSWTGTGRGQPGESIVKREYRWVLNDRFIEVRSPSVPMSSSSDSRSPSRTAHSFSIRRIDSRG
jgi:hypothetical protein